MLVARYFNFPYTAPVQRIRHYATLPRPSPRRRSTSRSPGPPVQREVRETQINLQRVLCSITISRELTETYEETFENSTTYRSKALFWRRRRRRCGGRRPRRRRCGAGGRCSLLALRWQISTRADRFKELLHLLRPRATRAHMLAKRAAQPNGVAERYLRRLVRAILQVRAEERDQPSPTAAACGAEVRGTQVTRARAPRAGGGRVQACRCQDDDLDPAAPPTIAGEPAMKNAAPAGARNSVAKCARACTATASCPSAASTARKMGPLAKRARTSPARAPSRRWPCAVKLSRQSPVPLSQCVASCHGART